MNRREHYRKGLSGLYLPYYDALCEELDPAKWSPTSGFRSIPQQDQYYAMGRTAIGVNPTKDDPLGQIVTNARGGFSAHNYGCATDWAPLNDKGQPYWPDWQTGAWKPYLEALEKLGLKSGSEWGDIPHNELKISRKWYLFLPDFQAGGLAAAEEKIKAFLCAK